MNCMDGWISPVELIYEEAKNSFLKQTDEFIMAKCEAVLGVKVDKDELIKAMHYDREQYKKGFENGYKKRATEIVRCEDCKYFGYDYEYKHICCTRVTYHPRVSNNDYCSYAERRKSE